MLICGKYTAALDVPVACSAAASPFVAATSLEGGSTKRKMRR